MYPTVKNPMPATKWYYELQTAKAQLGTKADKIQMTMMYMSFADANEWDACYDFLNENL